MTILHGKPIHVSDMQAFQRCRRLWDWSSLLRRNLTPTGVYMPFFTGRVIHGALDALYKYGTHPVDSVAQLVDNELADVRAKRPDYYAKMLPALTEQIALCEGMLTHYMQWRNTDKSDFADRNLDFITTEQHFAVPMRSQRGFISKRFYYEGRFDGVVRHKETGELFLWEVKTARSINERLNALAHEVQANAYMIAAQEMYREPIAGTIYTIMRKKLPAVPALLKNGFLSQNKAIDTTPERYLQSIRETHAHVATSAFIREYYGEMLQALLDDSNPFFARQVVRRTPAELKAFNSDFYAIATEMTRDNVKIYPHGTYQCVFCLFREPCIVKNNGGDHEALLQQFYTQNTYHEQKPDDE